MKKFLRRLGTFFAGLSILILLCLPSLLDSEKTPFAMFLLVSFLVLAASAGILFLCLKMNFKADMKDSAQESDPQQDEPNQQEL